jgi:hypothetical protein
MCCQAVPGGVKVDGATAMAELILRVETLNY